MLRNSLILALLVSVGLASIASGKDSPSTSQKSPKQQLFQVPLSFEANSGQTDARARYLARTRGLAVFLTSDEAVLKMMRGNSIEALHLQWMGSRAGRLAAEQPLPGKVNYLRGNDPAKWQTDVPTYGRVRYVGLYRGVDLVYYGNGQQLEYDLVVAPDADPVQVRVRLEGARHLRIARNGDLVIRLADGELRQHRPVIYQIVAGQRQRVNGGYVLRADNEVGFRIGRYDRKHELVIDPTLSYATYLGGIYTDLATAVAPDSSGNAYVAGYTLSGNFPTKNRYEGDRAETDAFLTKLNADGSGLVYSTYLGGNGVDAAYGVGVDRYGFAYVVGRADSTNFPVTANAFQKVNHGNADVFVTKFNQQGNGLVYSTYVGGTEFEWGVAMTLDSVHRVYVTGSTSSADFPLANAFQSARRGRVNAFAFRLSADGSSLSYSTYLGGSKRDEGTGIAVDSTGNTYVSGNAESEDFPVTPGAYQTVNHNTCSSNNFPITDDFVTKLSPTGSSLVYSTYLGGCDQDVAKGIAVDSQGRAYVTGYTRSGNFPVTSGAFQHRKAAGSEGYVTRLNAEGSGLSYSTYLTGSYGSFVESIAVDSSYHVFVTGFDGSPDFPLKSPISSTGSIIVAKLWATGGGLIWSTKYGSTANNEHGVCVRLDGNQNPYIAGGTGSSAFPTTNNAFQRSLGGKTDGFVMKIKN